MQAFAKANSSDFPKASIDCFREKVIPWLQTFPSIRIWIAGSVDPEDLLRIISELEEAHVLRWLIYVSDSNELSLKRVKKKIGGLKKETELKIYYFKHNLDTDKSPNEFQFILCRDDKMKIKETKKSQIVATLSESLCRFGILAFGGNRLKGELKDFKECCPDSQIFKRDH